MHLLSSETFSLFWLLFSSSAGTLSRHQLHYCFLQLADVSTVYQPPQLESYIVYWSLFESCTCRTHRKWRYGREPERSMCSHIHSKAPRHVDVCLSGFDNSMATLLTINKCPAWFICTVPCAGTGCCLPRQRRLKGIFYNSNDVSAILESLFRKVTYRSTSSTSNAL